MPDKCNRCFCHYKKSDYFVKDKEQGCPDWFC
uniref:Uncharacterized protein n=1 Tax=Rhizophora mucronata TaxID=61149 RepID=A0A2P2QF36_RHIMU